MSTVTPVAPRRTSLAAFTALRAAVAGALAVVVTFSADHTAAFGLAVFGGFALAQGAVVGAGVGSLVASPVGRVLTLVRGILLVVVGVVAVTLVGAATPGALLAVEVAGFLTSGALEVLAGLRRADASPVTRDLLTVGGLELLVGVLLAVLRPDPLVAVGVLSAWGAIVAVYLGIAAASIARREGGAA